MLVMSFVYLCTYIDKVNISKALYKEMTLIDI